MSSNDFRKLFKFVKHIGNLKRIRRTGWVRRNVSDPESVADHMYRMAILSFLAKPAEGIDKERCIKMCLVHDMAESIVGDLTPFDGVSKEQKFEKEQKAMKHLCGLVDEDVGKDIYSLWEEYESQITKESCYVKDLDKFDMIFQAFEYEELDKKPGGLQEFFDSTSGKFQTEQVKQWVEELHSVRKENSTND